MQILTTLWGVIFLGGVTLIWLGFVNPRNLWIVFMLMLPFVLIGLAYLNLYQLPPKGYERSTTNPRQNNDEA